jgi:ribosomal protein S27E
MYKVTKDTKYVTKHTRAGYNGRDIICPVCFRTRTVYHFAWTAISCGGGCNTMVEKPAWIIK